MWLYAVVILVLLALGYLGNSSNTKQIDSYQKFETDYLKPHDVDHLVAYKSGDLVMVEVYIKKDALGKKIYDDVREQKTPLTGSPSNGPQFYFTTSSFDGLKQDVAASEKDLPQAEKTPIIVTQHESILGNWLVQGIIMAELGSGRSLDIHYAPHVRW